MAISRARGGRADYLIAMASKARPGGKAVREVELDHSKMEKVAQAQEQIAHRIADAAPEMELDASPEKLRAFRENRDSLIKQKEPLRQQMAAIQREVQPKTEKLHAQNAPMRELNKKIAEASRPMGDLSARMGQLSMQHSTAVREAERTLRVLIKQSLQDGKAVPAPSA